MTTQQALPTAFPSALFLDVPPRQTWIKPAQKRIVLYGAGGLGRLAAELLCSAGISPDYFIDLHSQAETQLGIPVIPPAHLPATRSETTVLVCVVTSPFQPIRDYLNGLDFTDVRPFYDYAEFLIEKLHITNGWLAPKLADEDQQAIVHVYKNLANNASRAAYLQSLYWRIRREEISYEISPVTMEDKWFPPEILQALNQRETFVDGGAYTGEVTDAFLKRVQNQFKHIFAYEPDAENLAALERYRRGLPEQIKARLTIRPFALGTHTGRIQFMAGRNMASFASPKGQSATQLVSLDEQDISASFVKLHIEGAELGALNGAIHSLKRHRPLLAITIYHNADGLWRIPLLLLEHLPDYHFFIRAHAWCGISNILYAIPFERQAST